MARTIAISLSPNAQEADSQKAWELMHLTSTWQDESIIPIVAKKISHLLDNRFVALTSSGRQALYDILRATGIGQGDEVIIQSFTCIAVPAPIQWANATPIYADIKEGTYNLDPVDVRKKITSKTKAIIVQHTFGIPGPIEELKHIAQEHNLLFIEDLAHGFGGRHQGKPLGTFGDIAFLSFGRDKTISSVFGGAVVSSKRDLIEQIQQLGRNRKYPPNKWVFHQLLHPVLLSFIIPNYFRVNIGKAVLILAQKLGFLSKAVATNERTGGKPDHFFYRYSPALAQLLNLQLNRASSFTKRRQEVVARYIKEMKNGVPSISNTSKPSWLRFPIQVKNPKELLMAARRENMLLGDWYDGPLVPSNCNLESFGYTPGTAPIAEKTAKQVINLPTHPRLTDKDVQRVIEFTKTHAD